MAGFFSDRAQWMHERHEERVALLDLSEEDWPPDCPCEQCAWERRFEDYEWIKIPLSPDCLLMPDGVVEVMGDEIVEPADDPNSIHYIPF